MNKAMVLHFGVSAAVLSVAFASCGVCASTGRHHGRIKSSQVTVLNQHRLNEQLRTAVNAGHSAQVRFLLAQGADPNTRFYQQKDRSSTVLMEAAALGEFSVVQLLLSRRANIKARGYSLTLGAPRGDGDYHDSTALIEACLRDGNEDVIDLLLAQGADVNAKDRSGGTALSATVWLAEWGEAKTLLRHGAWANKATRRRIATEPNIP